jgi:quercetin dioxygenase-like cupin family protein
MKLREIFPEPIRQLPEADIPLRGITAYLSQAEAHQIIFMAFEEDVDLPEHTHATQWGFVFEGEIELTIGGQARTYRKGDRYFIPAGVKHSGRIRAGFAAMDYFDQPDRYRPK